MSLLLPEDLSCTICRDVFRDPVVLTCSHSYCRACLQNWWSSKQVLECPVCKKRSSSSDMTSNLVLKKVCEAILERKAKGDADRKVVCRLHAEKLKLFCVDHQEPLCLVCLHSDAHAGHNVKPIEEVTRKHREQLRDLLKPLKENLKKLEDVKEDLRQTAEHIQFQAQQTEKFLREQFKELQAFIQKEEETRMKALREEEKKKSLAMKVKIESLSKDIAALSETVRETEAPLGGEEAVFLQNFRSAVTRVQQSPPPGRATARVWSPHRPGQTPGKPDLQSLEENENHGLVHTCHSGPKLCKPRTFSVPEPDSCDLWTETEPSGQP